MRRVAADQHGVIGYSQLVSCGCSRRQIDGLVRRGELHGIHKGVYLLGPCLSFEGAAVAATLACGTGAVVSHRSAAWTYRLLPRPVEADRIDVLVAGRHLAGDRRIKTHETTSLRPHERRVRDGVPVTAPIRTLIDLAACSRPSELEQAVAEAFAGGLTNRNAIAREIARSPRRAGLASIRRLLDLPSGPALTRSAPERRLLRAIRVGGLPEPETNVRVGPWEVDFLWREARLVVELDAYATHSAPDRFERDRIKDAYLADRGLRVRRVTARQVRADLDGTVAAIRRALKLSRPPRPGARPP